MITSCIYIYTNYISFYTYQCLYLSFIAYLLDAIFEKSLVEREEFIFNEDYFGNDNLAKELRDMLQVQLVK